MKLKSWFVSFLGLIYFLFYIAYIFLMSLGSSRIEHGGEIIMGGIVIVAGLMFFICIIILVILRNPDKTRVAPTLALLFGFLGIIGLVVGIMNGLNTSLWPVFFIPLSWLIAGIIGFSEVKKNKMQKQLNNKKFIK